MKVVKIKSVSKVIINKILKLLKTHTIPEGFLLKSVQKIRDNKKSCNIETRQMICTLIQLTDFYITKIHCKALFKQTLVK